jgi:adenylate cyclase
MESDQVIFGAFRLDPGQRILWRDGVAVELGSRACDILCALAAADGVLVSKDVLMAKAWPGQIVEENTLQAQISLLRKALGEAGQRCIVTVPGHGYRLVREATTAAIAETRLQSGRPSIAMAAAPAAVFRPPPVANKPSIAILPFDNMSGDPDQEYFVDGMVEEILTALSRIRWLHVLARNSSFTYKGQAVDVKQVGRELGVHYLLEGSVRKVGNRVRISAQLIDAATAAHLWADRFDGLLEDVFALQDKVASSVAGEIEPTLQAAEATRSGNRPTADLSAYDLYLRAYAMVWSSATRIPEALRLMEQAIAPDPQYGPALGWAAACCQRLVYDNRSEDPAADRLRGTAFARQALAVAGDDPGILTNAAVALAGFGEDIKAMMALLDRALAFNPNYARGWHISGVLRCWAGQPDTAIAHAETALRLSPRARIGTSLLIIGSAHFFMRRFDAAVSKLRLAIQEDAGFPEPHRFLAACYAHMGLLDDARDIVVQLRAITSVVMPDVSVLRNADHRELILSGLRLAAAEL